MAGLRSGCGSGGRCWPLLRGLAQAGAESSGTGREATEASAITSTRNTCVLVTTTVCTGLRQRWMTTLYNDLPYLDALGISKTNPP